MRDLEGVFTSEQAEIGVVITMKEPTQAMRTEAASAGFYTSPGWHTKHPRLQRGGDNQAQMELGVAGFTDYSPNIDD